MGVWYLNSAVYALPLGDGEVRLATQATYQSARNSGESGNDFGEAVLLDWGVAKVWAMDGDESRRRVTNGLTALWPLYDEFRDAFVRRVNALSLGAGLDWDADMGSLVSPAQVETVQGDTDLVAFRQPGALPGRQL